MEVTPEQFVNIKSRMNKSRRNFDQARRLAIKVEAVRWWFNKIQHKLDDYERQAFKEVIGHRPRSSQKKLK